MGKFQESPLAHKYLDGLIGIEIGGSAHNSFNIAGCRNVDYTDSLETVFKKHEVELCGETMHVDILASGDDLPLDDSSIDYVLSSHVIEHFFDPIKAIKEWLRVIKPGGYIVCIVPHRLRTFDRNREATPIQELLDRHSGKIKDPKTDAHHTVWETKDFLEMCRILDFNVIEYLDIDDKVGNGFLVVIQKLKLPDFPAPER